MRKYSNSDPDCYWVEIEGAKFLYFPSDGGLYDDENLTPSGFMKVGKWGTLLDWKNKPLDIYCASEAFFAEYPEVLQDAPKPKPEYGSKEFWAEVWRKKKAKAAAAKEKEEAATAKTAAKTAAKIAKMVTKDPLASLTSKISGLKISA